jgi:PAS domain-containing protein
MAVLKDMPALVVLERFPVPALAITEDDTILFANSAFAEMLGYSGEEVLSLKFTRSSTPCPPTSPRCPSCASMPTSSSNWFIRTVR